MMYQPLKEVLPVDDYTKPPKIRIPWMNTIAVYKMMHLKGKPDVQNGSIIDPQRLR